MLIDILGPPRLWCQTNTRRASERKALEASLMKLIPLVYLPRVVTFSPVRTFHLFAEPIVVLLVSHPARFILWDSTHVKLIFLFHFFFGCSRFDLSIALLPVLFRCLSIDWSPRIWIHFHAHTEAPRVFAQIRSSKRAGAINGTMQATHSRCNLIIGCALSPNWFRFLFRSQHFAR